MDLDDMEGLYVGLLDQDEQRVFDEAVSKGWATRSYEGAGGFMGLAKVRLVRVPAHRAAERNDCNA